MNKTFDTRSRPLFFSYTVSIEICSCMYIRLRFQIKDLILVWKIHRRFAHKFPSNNMPTMTVSHTSSLRRSSRSRKRTTFHDEVPLSRIKGLTVAKQKGREGREGKEGKKNLRSKKSKSSKKTAPSECIKKDDGGTESLDFINLDDNDWMDDETM